MCDVFGVELSKKVSAMGHLLKNGPDKNKSSQKKHNTIYKLKNQWQLDN